VIFAYVLKGSNGRRYVGITNDVERRLNEHRSGKTKGGQIVGAFELLLTESYVDYGQARTREKYLKSGQGREWLDAIEGRTRPASGG
jgi:putative endonuclease